MVRRRLAAALLALSMVSGCYLPARTAGSRVRSLSGTAQHGDVISVPSGTLRDWSILVSPAQMGTEEAGSEEDNRLLSIRVLATEFDERSWQITAQYRFGYALNNTSIAWVNGSANYLLVRR